MSEAALLLRGIARRFGRRWVLRGVDLDARAGEAIGLTGRNGSGKTTLLRICATLLRPTRGEGRIFGATLVSESASIRERVGYLAHDAGLYANLTAAENLAFAQRMSGNRVDREMIRWALAEVGLGHEHGERVRGFSAGMRRRLALARLLLRPPSLLLLDEPYASFDVDGIDRVNDFAAEVKRAGGLVLIATHDLRRALPVIDRHVSITDGRLADRDLVEVEAWATAEEGAP
jgi:heme exporter protein A